MEEKKRESNSKGREKKINEENENRREWKWRKADRLKDRKLLVLSTNVQLQTSQRGRHSQLKYMTYIQITNSAKQVFMATRREHPQWHSTKLAIDIFGIFEHSVRVCNFMLVEAYFWIPFFTWAFWTNPLHQ